MPNPWVKQWEVQGTSGKFYTVSQRANGSFGCACASWKFQRADKTTGERADCQHILKKKLEMQQADLPKNTGYDAETLKKLAEKPKPVDIIGLRNGAIERLTQEGIIMAIKYVRTVTMWGLKDAKDYVDGLRAEGYQPYSYSAPVSASPWAHTPPVKIPPKAILQQPKGRKFRED